MRNLPRLLLSCLLFLLAGLYPGKALASFPGEADSIRQLRCRAVECELKGDRESAIDLNRQALNIAGRTYGTTAPFLADIYYDIGTLALNDSKFNLAEESFSHSIHLNPNYYSARIKLAEVMHLRGHSEDAVKETQLVLSKHRANVPARAILALSYQDLGKPYRAIRECYFLDQAMHGKNPPAPSLQALLPLPSSLPSSNSSAEDAKKNEIEKAAKEKAVKEKNEKEKVAKEKAAKEKSAREKAVKKVEKKSTKRVSSEPGSSTSLESKAILLTPVKAVPKKAVPKKAVQEDDNSETPENSAEDAIKEIVKPSVPKRVKVPEQTAKPKPRGGGLVPPPPPVVPVYSPMMPVVARPAAPKAKPIEKEKPKEKAPEVKEEKAPSTEEKDDDFLLDWGDAKNKKKK